jgi:hypothetical protein
MSEDQSRFRPSTIPGIGRLTGRVDRAIAWRVERALGPVYDRLEDQHRRINELQRRMDVRLPIAVNKANRALTEVQRMQPQTSSMELRLEELRQAVSTRLDPGTPEDQAEARRLLDEVRREHEQIRARMTAISWYEDRLRRLEEQDAPAEGTTR